MEYYAQHSNDASDFATWWFWERFKEYASGVGCMLLLWVPVLWLS